MTDNIPTEYHAFTYLRHWQAADKIIMAEELCNSDDPLFPLFLFLYEKTKILYNQLPTRKNGAIPFIHPLNVVLALKKARADNTIVLCAGLIHDYIEERVDVFKQQQGIEENKAGIEALDAHEAKEWHLLIEEMYTFCQKSGLPYTTVDEIIAITKLLTRHKRDFYYHSICHIFTSENDTTKERAIQIKLADRMHNILSVETFSREERLYQCYKNLFILNNAKKYLRDKLGENVFQTELSPTEILFKRCAKATFDAFLKICGLALTAGIGDVESMLQLAFKKFALEKKGITEVTQLAKEENHLMRLYHQVIRKYDLRLRHRWEELTAVKHNEVEYCKKFFADFKYTEEQIKAILELKDAYSLREVIAHLLYIPDYFILGFEYSSLFCQHLQKI